MSLLARYPWPTTEMSTLTSSIPCERTGATLVDMKTNVAVAAQMMATRMSRLRLIRFDIAWKEFMAHSSGWLVKTTPHPALPGVIDAG
jgi:hypothetical protein